jgi:Zn-dependent M28 family amino/carboxypeptidase
MEGRAPGTSGSRRARAFIESQLAASGAEAVDGSYAHPFSREGGNGVNLLALIPGRVYEDRYIVVTAHYDHVGIRDGQIFNGADDNASGVAALLAVARAFSAEPLAHSLLLAAVDDEESGMVGSQAFVDTPPVPVEQILLNVNFDMVSRTAGTLWASGATHTPALRPVLEALTGEAPVTVRLGHDSPGAPEGDDWTGASDHAPFHRAGVPFVYFGVEDHADYHRPTDDFGGVDPGEFVAAVRTIFIALPALDEALPLSGGPDSR